MRAKAISIDHIHRIYKKSAQYSHASLTDPVVTGFFVAKHLLVYHDHTRNILNEARTRSILKPLLKGVVLWMQKFEDDTEPFLPMFLLCMDDEEKNILFDHIIHVVRSDERISPIVFEALVYLVNGPKAIDVDNHKVDQLLEVFLISCHMIIRDRQSKVFFYEKFMRMFAFLSGRSIHVEFFKDGARYLFYESAVYISYEAWKQIWMLRLLRKLGVVNFREIWKGAMENNKHLIRALEVYGRIRGLRRLARVLWKDFSHEASFNYYEWTREFGNLDHILMLGNYQVPDKPCELLAHHAHLAIVRVQGKRYVLYNHKNIECIILPCKSKVRDSWQILASIVI